MSTTLNGGGSAKRCPRGTSKRCVKAASKPKSKAGKPAKAAGKAAKAAGSGCKRTKGPDSKAPYGYRKTDGQPCLKRGPARKKANTGSRSKSASAKK